MKGVVYRMNYIVTFIFGIAFTLIVFPFLQSIGELIIMVTEQLKAKINISIAESAQKIEEISSTSSCDNVIGFRCPISVTEEDDEEEECLD